MRLPRLRLTVRRLMIVVLILGGGFGWLAYKVRQARSQRETVEAVRSAGGSILYDWQSDGGKIRLGKGTNLISNEVPGRPKWLVDRLGVDYFGHVEQITMDNRSFNHTTEVKSELLARISQLPGLTHLWFQNRVISDSSLVHLEGMSGLEVLSLRGCIDVTDAGVAHIEKLTGLKELYLEHTQVSDKGLACLHGLTRLDCLNLGYTRVTNAGLVHLEGLTNLETLGLDGTQIGGPRLAAFLKGRTRFVGLYLSNTQVTDSDLVSLSQMNRLGWLGLRNDNITDSGLSSLRSLTGLKSLDIYGTKVSREGVMDLRGKLNSTSIDSDYR